MGHVSRWSFLSIILCRSHQWVVVVDDGFFSSPCILLENLEWVVVVDDFIFMYPF